MSHVYCPECGFQNPEAANYCAKCGALLVRDESGSDTTMSYTPEEGDDEDAAILDEIKTEGPALVVRSGGGRAGEHFLLENEQHDRRPLARLRRLPRRRDGLAPARAGLARRTASS